VHAAFERQLGCDGDLDPTRKTSGRLRAEDRVVCPTKAGGADADRDRTRLSCEGGRRHSGAPQKGSEKDRGSADPHDYAFTGTELKSGVTARKPIQPRAELIARSAQRASSFSMTVAAPLTSPRI
jgi:hypothetical protein